MRVLRVFAAICFLALPLPAAAQTMQAGETAANHPAEPLVADNVPVQEIPADQAIQTRLTDVLQATEWFADVKVHVRDSVAFLEGTARDADRKQWAAELAGNTEGVAAVVNRLEVKKKFDVAETLQVISSSLRTLRDDFLAHSPLIVAGLLAVLLTALVSRLIRAVVARVAARSKLRSSVQDLVLHLLTIAVWVTGLLVAAVISFPGMTPAKALAMLGLGSVAIGFAFKDIFENFFAGILILWKYPFDKGDFVECGDVKGRIEDITIRMSMIRQVDGQLVVVPNALLFKNAVDVLTNRPARRTTVMCGVAYDTDLDQAREVLQTAVESCSTVKQDDPVEIFAREFADSSINFEVTWWTGATPKDIRESRDEVVRAVKRALDEAGIEIPFPQRTLWLPEPVRTQTVRAASADPRSLQPEGTSA